MAIQNNRVNYTLTDADLNRLRAAFQQIIGILTPFAQALTTEDRQFLPKMDVSNKAFVSDAMVAVKSNPDFIPAYLATDAMDLDYKLFEQLEEFIGNAETVKEMLSDTQMLAGSEAYSNALAAYRLFGAAAKAGLNGADSVYEKLASRFAGQGSTAAATTTL